MRMTPVFLLALLVPALAAQTATPVPAAAPHLLFDTVGPDGWRMRLGPTNLGSLLASEKGRTMWEPQVAPLLGAWQQLVGDEAMFAAARTRTLGYGGRIRIGIWFPEDAGGGGPAFVGAALDADGRTDLAALATDLRELASRAMPGEWRDVDVAGTKVQARQDGETLLSAPIAEGGHLLFAFTRAGELGTALAHARSLAAGLTGKPPAPNTAALLWQIDVAGLVRIAQAEQAGIEATILKALGIDTLGNAALSVGTAGPHVQLELTQRFTSDQRGLFGLLFPATHGISPLVHAAATSPGSWKVGRLDLRPLYRLVADVAVAVGRVTAEEFHAETKKELGIDPDKDLLAHLTDEVLLTGSPLGAFDDASEATWSMTIRLTDEAAFRRGLEAMLPHTKPLLSREATQKHGDLDVYRYGGMFGYDLWLSVGNGVFVVAGGRDAEALVGQMLDRCKDLPKEAPAAPTFAALQRFLPPGCNGIATGELGAVLTLPGEFWFGMLDELTVLGAGGRQAPTAEEREAMRALLREHKLDVLRTATGYADRQWCWRMYW